jgi:hypothetical protein
MKSPLLIGLGSLLLLSVAAGQSQRSVSAQDLYEQGRAAYFRKDYATAKARLLKVQKMDPNHLPTKVILHQLIESEAQAALKAASLESRMQRVTVPLLVLENTKVREALEFVQIKAAEAGQHGVRPNFAIKITPATEAKMLTLHLNQVTLHEALRSIAELASLEVTYEPNVVTIASR